ncbi:hypothetical protein ACX6XY_13375 [Streptomyces sp. O3]
MAFVESPVQLLNVLEWAHSSTTPATTRTATPPASGTPASGTPERGMPAPGTPDPRASGAPASSAPEPEPERGAPERGAPEPTRGAPDRGAPAPADPPAPAARTATGLTVIVLSPVDPMSRGQLRRMTELAWDEGHTVRWEEARGGAAAAVRTVGGLARLLRGARRVVIGDPFSRYVQLLLTLTHARDLVVVDDGTATMEFLTQLASGERLVRWHRRGGRRGARDVLFAPVSASARRRLTPSGARDVEVFSSMPVRAPAGIRITENDFSWTRARFGPPRVCESADIVGTSLVETGVVDRERYLAAVARLARTHGAGRYFAHRRELPEKLQRLSAETGLDIVRPDLPLELVARRGPIGRTIVSFPSTVVHTLPLALAGAGVEVAVCDIDPTWLTDHASPRAQGFLSGVTGTARDVHRLRSVRTA